MGSAQAVIGRVVTLTRRLTGVPDWPLAGGSLLGLLAIVEVAQGERIAAAETSTGMLLGLGATVPVAFARSHSLVAAVTITVATALTLASGFRPTVAGVVAQLCVLYVVGRRYPRRVSLPFLLPFVVAVTAPAGDPSTDRAGAILLLALVTATVATAVIRRAGQEAAERDVSQQAVADTLLQYAARGERARIARELHDVVAHHISMVAVQAETARLTTPGLPAAGAERLVAIADTARLALTEMRRLLGVLRDDAGAEAIRRPQPGLEQLIDLVDEVRDATGASTRLIVRGRVERLDPGVELTAYRIVQEALTNARRHAPSVAVDVELTYTGDSIRICVRDNGPGPAARPSDGHGLLGMRERAAMAGGTLWTGGSSVGGFLVEAVLPVTKAGLMP